jgi:hypothetical protein
MLSLKHPVARFLCRLSGFRSFSVWFHQSAGDIESVRRQAAQTSFWLWLRTVRKFLKVWPWPLFGTCDPRRTSADLGQVKDSFRKACPKCLDKHHSLKVRKTIENTDELDDLKWQRLHWTMAMLVDTQNDSCERIHAHHNRISKDATLPYFTAKSLIKSAQRGAKCAHTLNPRE